MIIDEPLQQYIVQQSDRPGKAEIRFMSWRYPGLIVGQNPKNDHLDELDAHFYEHFFKHVYENQYELLSHSAPSWILSLAENLASSILQDGATEWHYS